MGKFFRALSSMMRTMWFPFSFAQLRSPSLLYDLLLKSCHRELLFKKINVISFYRIIIIVVMITMEKSSLSFHFFCYEYSKKRSTEKLIGKEDAKMCEGKTEKASETLCEKLHPHLTPLLNTEVFQQWRTKYFSRHIVVTESSNRIISRPKAKNDYERSNNKKNSNGDEKSSRIISSAMKNDFQFFPHIHRMLSKKKRELRNAVVKWRMTRWQHYHHYFNVSILLSLPIFRFYRNNAKRRSAIEPKINSRCERGPRE